MALSKEKFNVSESEKESLGNKITDIGILEKEKSRREILTFDMKKLNFLDFRCRLMRQCQKYLEIK
jgi:hypothetical protein